MLSRHISFHLALLVMAICSQAEEASRLRILRESAGTAPVLEVTKANQKPLFQVVRLNAQAIEIAEVRYGVVRLKLPPDSVGPMIWMFADVGNIDEYELMSAQGGAPIRGNLRHIYPPLTNRDEEASDRPRLKAHSLPKPWDLLELHLLGYPAAILQPDTEYLIWFRFSDRQPADILMSAAVLEPAVKLEAEILPGLLGLPELGLPQ